MHFLRGLADLVTVVGLALLVSALVRKLPETPAIIISGAALIGLYYVGNRWIERRHPRELDFNRLPGALLGFLLGTAIFSLMMGVLWLLKSYQPTECCRTAVLATAILPSFLTGLFEETIFRGFLFRLIENLGGRWTALAITSALFGGVHLLNPHSTIWGAIAIAVEAGILLGAAYSATGSLWLAVGIHAGWNYAEGSLFGAVLSGHEVRGFTQAAMHGSTALTGGAFGPENSVPAVIVCLITASFFLRKMLRPKQTPAQPAGSFHPHSE